MPRRLLSPDLVLVVSCWRVGVCSALLMTILPQFGVDGRQPQRENMPAGRACFLFGALLRLPQALFEFGGVVKPRIAFAKLFGSSASQIVVA